MLKCKGKSYGFFGIIKNYFIGGWDNETIYLPLTTDVWVQITNEAKNLYTVDKAQGFRLITNDVIVSDVEQLCNIQFQPNGIGQDNKTWCYRIVVKRNAIDRIIWEFEVIGAGNRVLRNVEFPYYLYPNDEIRIEMRSTSLAPGTVEYYKMAITIQSID